MKIEVIRRRGDIDKLYSDWNAFLRDDSRTPDGMDITSGFEWTTSLLDAFLGEEVPWFVLVASDARGVAGILPMYRVRSSGGSVWPRDIAPMTQLYGGRNGFLLRTDAPHALRAMLRYLHRSIDGWHSMHLRVVDGSRSERALDDALNGALSCMEPYNRETSPFVRLPDDLDTYLGSLKTGFRTELQRRERRLRDVGRLEFRVYDSPEQVDAYWKDIISVELQSWKEAAGSSITRKAEQDRFYRTLLPRAAGAGQLLGGLLLLDDRPIAYRLSVVSGDTALGLKTSYAENVKAFAPATVLQWMYLREMHRRGLRVFDFTGTCDPHKMRWGCDTYAQTTYRIYRQSVGGALAQVGRRALSAVRKLAAHA